MKCMISFLCLLLFMSFSSQIITNTNTNEHEPEYETPVYVKQSNGNLQNNMSDVLDKDFNIEDLKQWLKQIISQNINTLSHEKKRKNLHNILTMKEKLKMFISSSFGKTTELLRILDNKAKKLKVIDDKIQHDFPKSTHQKFSLLEKETVQLNKELGKEKHVMMRVINNLARNNTMRNSPAESTRDRQMNLVDSINLQLQGQMSLPFFNEAYKGFIIYVTSNEKESKHVKGRDNKSLARYYIDQHWQRFLEKAKTEWEAVKKLSMF